VGGIEAEGRELLSVTVKLDFGGRCRETTPTGAGSIIDITSNWGGLDHKNNGSEADPEKGLHRGRGTGVVRRAPVRVGQRHK
jgi:hypothetical protein